LPSDAVDDVERAIKASSELVRMCNDLLDISHLEAGKMPLNLQAFDLTTVTRSGIAAVRALANGRQVVLVAPEELPVLCDRDAIRRVVENLVANGLKHAPEGTEVTVTVERRGANVLISVTDRGPGIPSELHHKIFDKLGQVEVRKDQNYHATGLGLAFCRLAVRAHGGDITVQSDEGTGNTFVVTLPQGRR